MRRSTTFKRTCNTASLSEGVRLGHKIKAERTRIETMTKRPGADAGENSANWRSLPRRARGAGLPSPDGIRGACALVCTDTRHIVAGGAPGSPQDAAHRLKGHLSLVDRGLGHVPLAAPTAHPNALPADPCDALALTCAHQCMFRAFVA